MSMNASVTMKRKPASVSHNIYEVLDHGQAIGQIKARVVIFKPLLSSLDLGLWLTVLRNYQSGSYYWNHISPLSIT